MDPGAQVRLTETPKSRMMASTNQGDTLSIEAGFLDVETGTKPSAPRFLSMRGVVIALLLLGFAVAMAWGSIAMRRTKMEKTRELFGEPAIFALQYGKSFHITLPAGSPSIDPQRGKFWIQPDGSQRTNWTSTPGLGHFRHALLEQTHYDWGTLVDEEVIAIPIASPKYVTVELEGPPVEVQSTRIEIELSEGWVGLAGKKQSVKVTPRVRTALENFVLTRKDVNNDYTR
jgi:hypothetical protein